MKKINLLMILVFLVQGFFTSCTSTPLSENNNISSIQEPQDPPNVLFVKQLQDKLNQNDLLGAIEHFQNIPDELKVIDIVSGDTAYSNRNLAKKGDVASMVKKYD